MAQQTNLTAVDWLIEQLVDLDKQLDGRRKSDDYTVIKLNPTKIYAQAKAMEKEQIQQAYIEGAEMAKEVFKDELKNVYVLPKT